MNITKWVVEKIGIDTIIIYAIDFLSDIVKPILIKYTNEKWLQSVIKGIKNSPLMSKMEEYAKRTDNKVDDAVVKELNEILDFFLIKEA